MPARRPSLLARLLDRACRVRPHLVAGLAVGWLATAASGGGDFPFRWL